MTDKTFTSALLEHVILSEEALVRHTIQADEELRHLHFVLVEQPEIDETALLSLVSSLWGFEVRRAEDYLTIHPAPFLLEQVTPELSMYWGVLPWKWRQDWETLEVLCVAPPTKATEAELVRRTHAKNFQFTLCSAEDFEAAHNHHFALTSSFSSIPVLTGPSESAESVSVEEDGLATVGQSTFSSGSLSVMTKVLGERWQIECPLAKGGMGSVFLAKDLHGDRQVAVKFLHAQLRMEQTERQRFVLEGRILQQLKHKNIVDVLHVGWEEEIGLYCVMEYLQGYNLYEAVERLGLLSWDYLLKTFIATCDAMEYAHNERVLHRDLKPENLFLVDGVRSVPNVRVLDFGIAKLLDYQQELTQTGITLGTPMYIAPEQAMGLALDERADVYALAAILYECLAGCPPFDFPTAYEIMGAKVSYLPPKLSVSAPHIEWPPMLEQVLLRGLATRPEQRYKSMTEFREGLLNCLKQISVDELKQPRNTTPAAVQGSNTPGSMELEVQWESELATASVASRSFAPSGSGLDPEEAFLSVPSGKSNMAPELNVGSRHKRPEAKFVKTMEVERIPSLLRGIGDRKPESRSNLPTAHGKATSDSASYYIPEEAGNFQWIALMLLVLLLVAAMMLGFWWAL